MKAVYIQHGCVYIKQLIFTDLNVHAQSLFIYDSFASVECEKNRVYVVFYYYYYLSLCNKIAIIYSISKKVYALRVQVNFKPLGQTKYERLGSVLK